MQALEIRCELAKFKIFQLVHGEAAECPDCPIELLLSVAAELGANDYRRGSHEVPTLFMGEPILVSEWLEGYQDANQRHVKALYDAEQAKTHPASNYDYTNLINAAETEAARGCGQSDILYEQRVQDAYASILANAPDAERAATEEALKARGFDPDFHPYEAGPGECSLTGIEEYCCPCGRHP